VNRPGATGALQIRRRKRNPGTVKQYDGKVKTWIRFNEEGDGHASYDPLDVGPDKFDLYAGWLLGDAEHGVPGVSQDKDLNGFRSALNRYFEENERGRPLKGTEIEATISQYYILQILSKQIRGEDAGLERVPCPEGLFVYLLQQAEACMDMTRLSWYATFFLQLLGWLRGNSVGGFRPGDVAFDLGGMLNLSIRKMKNRKQFEVHPGLISVPPGPTPMHVRSRVLRVIRRALHADPAFYMVVARSQDPVKVAAGADRSAVILTRQLRVMSRDFAVSLPAGAMIASHSWREMAAVACYQARYDSLRMTEQGFWQNMATMFSAYIKPYLSIFPFSPWLAELFDFLKAGG
jgi:hypothetical protein